MRAASFTQHGPEYQFQFTFDKALVDLIKQTVPTFARSYSPPTKTWTVGAYYARALAREMESIGGRVRDGRGSLSPPTHGTTSAAITGGPESSAARTPR